MQNPQVSVIVPIYNVERYLERCVNSILCQSFSDFELLLVDDGSPDDCGNICDKYAAQDDRVNVIHKTNGGLSDARNAGIDASKADHLMFIDGDDWIDPDMIDLLWRVMQATDADISECSFRNIYQDSAIEETPCTGQVVIGTGIDGIRGILEWKNFKSVAWNKLYRRSVIGEIRYPIGKTHEDEFTTYRFYYNAKKLAYVDISKYNYVRFRPDSIISGFSEKNLDICDALRERREFIIKHELYQLEEQSNNVYCWLLLENLTKCSEHNIEGERLKRVMEMASEDLNYFKTHPVQSDYIEWLAMLQCDGLKKTALKWRNSQNIY